MANAVVPTPVFQALARDLNKIYCEVCGSSWDKKNIKRAKLSQVKVDKFHDLAEKWKKYDHKFNKVLESVD